MSKIKTIALVGLLAIPLGLGCQPAEEKRAETRSQAMKGPHRGPGQMIKEALKEVDLRPDQRQAVDQLHQKTRARLAPMRQARAALMREAASQVREGRVDRSRIDPLVATMKDRARAARPVVVAALNELHDLLDAAQRRQFVTALKERHQALRARHGHGPGRLLRHVAEKLGLVEEQRVRIKDALRETFGDRRAAMKKRFHRFRDRVHAAAEAFEGDDFDAARIELFKGLHHRGHHKLDLVLGAARIVLPILTASQRDRIAAHLEARAAVLLRDDG